MPPEVLLTNLAFGESPRWHEGRLWVADWGIQEIVAVDRDGRREVAATCHFPSFQAICFDWVMACPTVSASMQIANAADASRTGQVVSVKAPAPHAGWP